MILNISPFIFTIKSFILRAYSKSIHYSLHFVILLGQGDGVNIASDMKLSQFDLISTPTGTEVTLRNKGNNNLTFQV